jgi:glyoxylase-like metal-dependent hydrolase (beta-lactamase superfamily II)
LPLFRPSGGCPGCPADELREVAEDTYAFVSGGYVSFFVVTDAGVIATDPSSQNGPERAEAYAAAIASVTEQPVRYLIYSHEHADHAIGGDVFAETATFVSHRNAVQPIADLGEPRAPVPTISFSDEMAIELGGTTVELYYAGRNHSDSSIVLLHPAQGLPSRSISSQSRRSHSRTCRTPTQRSGSSRCGGSTGTSTSTRW